METLGDRIRRMNNDELGALLFVHQIKALSGFMAGGGAGCLDAVQLKHAMREPAPRSKELNVKGHSKGHKAPHLTRLNRERNPKLAVEPDAVIRGTYESKKHRRTMERIIGRKLKAYEDVHHINGIRNDNRPENLQIMNHSDHLKLHWQMAKERGVI